MAYLNLSTSVIASAERQGLTPVQLLEQRLSVWQYDFGTGEWPERLNIKRRDGVAAAHAGGAACKVCARRMRSRCLCLCVLTLLSDDARA